MKYNVRMSFVDAMDLLTELMETPGMDRIACMIAARMLKSFDDPNDLRNAILDYFGSYETFKSIDGAQRLIDMFGEVILGDDKCVR